MSVNTLGSNRDELSNLDLVELQRQIDQNCLVTDPRRNRPRWFDGRFLAARDLAGEQNYFLVRQADLGRAGGTGVVQGLTVTQAAAGTTGASILRIDAGFGFTAAGEMVVLAAALDVNPADIPTLQRLDAAFGLQEIPNEPGRSRNGLYVLALRPVEWTANPIAAYPTSLTGERTVQDGEIIEGVAVALVPYPDAAADNWARRRARAARDLFVAGRDWGFASGALPLALLALQGNRVVWLDPYLARRDAGAERPAGMDFGFGARALREAQLLQYDQHLADVLNSVGDAAFSAAAWFDALPPVGRLPAQCVDANALTQLYFPPTMTVELAFVPDDEIPAVIEESLSLPPLDLLADADTQAGTAVMILAPLPRETFAPWYGKLGGRTLKLLTPVRELKGNPRALGFSLNYLRQAGLTDQPAPGAVTDASDDWKTLLRTAQARHLLWYVRRRHVPAAANVAGAAVDATSPEVASPKDLVTILEADPAAKQGWEKLQAGATPEQAALLQRMKERRLLDNPTLIKSLIAAASDPSLSPEGVLTALAPATNPDFGKGLALLAREDPALGRALVKDAVIASGVLPAIDRLARQVSPDALAALIKDLKLALKKPAVELVAAVAALCAKYLKPAK